MIVSAAHKTWLDKHLDNLFHFGKGAKTFGGFGYLDSNGKIDPNENIQTYITCRMTHIYSMYVFDHKYELENDTENENNEKCEKVLIAEKLAAHGIESLIDYVQDKENGGFYESITQVVEKSFEHSNDNTGKSEDQHKKTTKINIEPEGNTYTKVAYAHAFVMLAASSGVLANIARAKELFKIIESVEEKYFWDKANNKTIEAYSSDWSDCERYRGINAAMHTVEAYLQTDSMLNRFPQLSKIDWLERAEHLVKFACKIARDNKYMLPEHFDEQWECIYDYNIDDKAHQFRPFGVTIGHSMEWCRLGVQLVLALYKRNGDFSSNSLQILRDCVGLFNVALLNWGIDGKEGFTYTTDFCGQPIIHDRMHWVLCEAIGATVALKQVKKILESKEIDTAFMNCDFGLYNRNRFSNIRQVKIGCIDLYDYWYTKFITFADEFFITKDNKWNHQLDKNNMVATDIWHGRPDIYHAYQALWFAKNQTIFLAKDM